MHDGFGCVESFQSLNGTRLVEWETNPGLMGSLLDRFPYAGRTEKCGQPLNFTFNFTHGGQLHIGTAFIKLCP